MLSYITIHFGAYRGQVDVSSRTRFARRPRFQIQALPAGFKAREDSIEARTGEFENDPCFNGF
jgi:hypothetical protein